MCLAYFKTYRYTCGHRSKAQLASSTACLSILHGLMLAPESAPRTQAKCEDPVCPRRHRSVTGANAARGRGLCRGRNEEGGGGDWWEERAWLARGRLDREAGTYLIKAAFT
ncbi:hypothetical protein B0H21DRAFT_712672 [Amylocystis lapponica]|nr:hypothetical protein B0H21DRAFT_712672 [Amylocystis lapponica]